MLQKLTKYLVTWDLPVLTPGTDAISWEEIREVVHTGVDLYWDMKGERKLLPFLLLSDYLRVHDGYEALIRLGRSSEVNDGLSFVRGQTL